MMLERKTTYLVTNHKHTGTFDYKTLHTITLYHRQDKMPYNNKQIFKIL